MSRKLSILVSGMIAADPGQGGATWAVLQYLLGFRELGHNVCFVEPVRLSSVKPAGATFADSLNARYFRRVATDFGLSEIAALLLDGTRNTVGLPYDQIEETARRSDLLINLSGLLTDERLTCRIPARVYLDLDPAFNQFWFAQGLDPGYSRHTHFATVGLEVGQPGCLVPDCARTWITTLQPVVLSHWRPAGRIAHDALTTVANWRSYGSIDHDGAFYGQKAHSFREYFTLPTRTRARCAPALAIHPDETRDLADLRANGWELLDPARVTGTPQAYQQFIQGSRAELGIAKSGYVRSRCGWFSDRSCCYLASGRPVLAQDTGFSRTLPTGDGLLSFSSMEELLRAIELVLSDYDAHARAARRIADEYLDSSNVLARLLQAIGV